MADPIHDVTDTQFSLLLDAAPDAMVIVDQHGVIRLVNAQVERLFGYERSGLLGQNLSILIPSRLRTAHEAHRAAYMRQPAHKPKNGRVDLTALHRNGREIPVEITLSPFTTEGGTLVISAIRDISERKTAEERFRALEAERARLIQERSVHAEANRIKDEFLATLSHELRTPLNAILGWMSLIDTGTLPQAQVDRALATISRNARAQAQLVEDLLDVSRILAGKLELRATALDLADLAEAALDVVRPSADAKRIGLVTRFERRPILIMGDADRLQQVIWNLLSNAVKFTPAGGRVELEIQTHPGTAEVAVRDTGQGIPADFAPHVFDRFRQADSSTTRPHGGLGLGLAIARSIVELHGGRIECASDGVGQGSVFRVELPVGAVTERRSGTRPKPELSALRGAHVLVVDDQEDERALLAAVFEHAGAVVRAAASVAEALEAMAASKPQLLVSDLAMPQEDGYALVRRVRGSPALREVAALAVTAHARPEDRDAALAAGFDAYISKPLDRELLLARATGLLTRARRARHFAAGDP